MKTVDELRPELEEMLGSAENGLVTVMTAIILIVREYATLKLNMGDLKHHDQLMGLYANLAMTDFTAMDLNSERR